MFKKLLFKSLALICMACTAVACSEEPAPVAATADTDATPATYVYPLELECAAPAFDGAVSRAAAWDEGAKIYLVLFKDADKVFGNATYNDGVWQIETKEELADIAESRVNAVYFQNPGFNEMGIVLLEPTSIPFLGKGTYSVSDGKVKVNVTLAPLVWRMRFAGTENTSITLVKGAENEMSYFSAFFDDDYTLFTDAMNAKLTVGADGYTPYIYGLFNNGSDANKITVLINESGKSYTCTINGSSLAVGQSGFLTLPSDSDANGWELLSGPNPYLSMEYYKDLGRTVDEIKTAYGKPLLEFEEYSQIMYAPTDHKDIIEYIAYKYNDKNVVTNVSLLLLNADPRIIEAFNELYCLSDHNDKQYLWVDNADKPTMAIYYSVDIKAIEYALLTPDSDINIDRQDFDSEDIDLGAIHKAAYRTRQMCGSKFDISQF